MERFAERNAEINRACHPGDLYSDYRQVSNIRRTLVGNKIVDHSDVHV